MSDDVRDTSYADRLRQRAQQDSQEPRPEIAQVLRDAAAVDADLPKLRQASRTGMRQ